MRPRAASEMLQALLLLIAAGKATVAPKYPSSVSAASAAAPAPRAVRSLRDTCRAGGAAAWAAPSPAPPRRRRSTRATETSSAAGSSCAPRSRTASSVSAPVTRPPQWRTAAWRLIRQHRAWTRSMVIWLRLSPDDMFEVHVSPSHQDFGGPLLHFRSSCDGRAEGSQAWGSASRGTRSSCARPWCARTARGTCCGSPPWRSSGRTA